MVPSRSTCAKLAARPLSWWMRWARGSSGCFPHLGNAVTLRWRAAIASADDTADEGWTKRMALWEAEDGALVIEAALLKRPPSARAPSPAQVHGPA